MSIFEKTREFFDPKKLRENIHRNVLESFNKKLNEIETSDYKLKVKDLSIERRPISFADQKKAILEKKDITLPLKGTVDLIHKKTGDVVESKTLTLAHVPYVTERNTVIYNGSEYESQMQQRLLPGVYSRIRQDGYPEAHINPAPKTGVAARILFIPEKQLFVMMIQSTQVRLYGLLKDIGVSDSEMRAAWGDQIFNINRAAYKGDEVAKAYEKLFGR